MVVNDNAGCLNARVVWATIASRLAPTWGVLHTRISSDCVYREPHASTASLQSCTQRLRPDWSLRLACVVRARREGRV
ncbi:hypothetical protein C1890_02320 [Pseudomonas sp. DP16D-R1]|nr:hypothetical protein C1890_02320 [Pseudomonas sp. DP16D-R1]